MSGHEATIIVTVAASFGLAVILGFIVTKLGIPAMVGYLLAGVVVGPATPGIVADVQVAGELAEIGVILLMFSVGLHLSLDDLLAVKRIALPGAIFQMAVATVLGTVLALQWGWSLTAAVVFGVSLSCASTIVLLKAMEARGLLGTMNGRIAVGWLVVEDLVTVIALVVLPPLASQPGVIEASIEDQSPTWLLVGLTISQVVLFMVLMLVFGRRALPWLLWQVGRTGSRELFTLTAVAIAIGIAVGAAELFNVSIALGAFVAGMVLRESELRHRVGQDTLPLRDVFAVLFFVSVGMLLEPSILVDQPWRVVAVVAIILVGKSLAAVALVLLLKYPITSAFVMGASLAQIGEFSFILAGLGLTLGMLPAEGVSLVVAAAFISIALNPLMFVLSDAARSILIRRSKWARRLEFETDPLAVLPMGHTIEPPVGHVILVGYGRVGRRIFSRLQEHGIECVVVEMTRERVEDLRKDGHLAIVGDATNAAALEAAGIHEAIAVVAAIPASSGVRRVADTASRVNPQVRLILRTHDEDDWEALQERAFSSVYYGEDELASSMVQPLLASGPDPSPGRAT